MRTFETKEAVREKVNVKVGLVGPSGSGKTGSALELAHGFQEVYGGDIYYIDSEAKRALHYAGQKMFSNPAKTFKFKHTPFAAPFSPADYLEVIKHCISKGAKTLIIDSMSHEHEGPGGVLEMHEQEAARLAALWKTSEDKTNIPAWAKPKAARQELVNYILQQQVNFIFCFRAKEKIKIKTGEKPVSLGWQPIAGEGYVYEMDLNCLLPPGSNGKPEWLPEEAAEKVMIKLPAQFKDIFLSKPALSAAIGVKLAQWASGDVTAAAPAAATAPVVTSAPVPAVTPASAATVPAAASTPAPAPVAPPVELWTGLGRLEEVKKEDSKPGAESKWTRWGVRIGDRWYGTFSATLGKEIDAAYAELRSINLKFKTRDLKGRTYYDITDCAQVEKTAAPVGLPPVDPAEVPL